MSSSTLLQTFEKEQRETASSAKLPPFGAGDTVRVHVKIQEGDKERVQPFQGIVLQRRHKNTPGETFTVRKVSEGVEVERIFPLLSPNIIKIERVKEGVVRRARLYYLRGRKGKSARVKGKILRKETK
ncbi:MAG: 50S ribosomal protein L19 [Cytophagales bacterium]|nr:50S ribosomal protein L19 [Cytophagales bacterium]